MHPQGAMGEGTVLEAGGGSSPIVSSKAALFQISNLIEVRNRDFVIITCLSHVNA
jgi:hypothetical protein